MMELSKHFYTKFTLEIGIFALTESINEKSISATAIPVDIRSETENINEFLYIFQGS